MKTRVSNKGQVALPEPLRRRLAICAGDMLDVKFEGESIVLTPRPKRKHRARIVTDPITGLPVLAAGPGAPKLTSKQVAEMLADFP
jgi:AbrB family looped-hinge helix DNA binding protein